MILQFLLSFSSLLTDELRIAAEHLVEHYRERKKLEVKKTRILSSL